jgi:hypothetical protein
MKNKPAVAFCLMCLVLGKLAPWGFIVLGAVLSLTTKSPENAATAAYCTAFGLLLLTVSFLLKRLKNTQSNSST